MQDNLHLYVIYDHPLDYPEHWVVRQYKQSDKGLESEGFHLFNSLEEARSIIPKGLVRFPRDEEEDDPVIVETWM